MIKNYDKKVFEEMRKFSTCVVWSIHTSYLCEQQNQKIVWWNKQADEINRVFFVWERPQFCSRGTTHNALYYVGKLEPSFMDV